jgi:ribosomal protein S18 acetylase RimI-like enzyme
MPADAAENCEQILRALPQWFGIEEAIVGYRKDIEQMPTWIAVDNDRIVGFLTVRHHNEYSAEIQVMGVLSEYHRHGVGRALVEHIEKLLREKNMEYLEVKTLAPSDPNEPYQRTRRFYAGVGFRPLEENKLWGDANPCLIMIKKL